MSGLSGLSHAGLSLAFLQEDASSNDHLLVVFVGIAAFSLLLQALMLVGAGVGALLLQRKLMAQIDTLKASVMPVVGKAQGLVEQVSAVTKDLTPTIRNISGKVETIAGHAEEISVLAKSKAEEFAPTLSKANETILNANATVMDATTRTHEQLLRVNQMISDTLTATERAGKKMAHNITQPGREIAGLATGMKVAVQTFFEKDKSAGRPPAAEYETKEYHPRTASAVADALRRDRSNDIGL